MRQNLRNERPKVERILWQRLRDSNLGYKFRRQQGVGKYVVDFYCPELKLVIEIDGATHSTEEEIKYNQIREEFLKNLGLKIKRYNNSNVKNYIGGIIEDLLDFIKDCESGK